MKTIKNQIFPEERALYGEDGIHIIDCRFEGELDGESALKECRNIKAQGCEFLLRYPLWHDMGAELLGCKMAESCRAALWYSTDISIKDCELHGTKALRECRRVKIENSDIISAEFGWSSGDIDILNSRATGEYFMLRADNIKIRGLDFHGKYSFQYVENALIEDSVLDTKDAFWHAKGVTLRNCTVKGEYLGWYCEDVTFENCKIIGTQPFCYCKGLRLIDCEMHECDLAFEKSEVDATVTTEVISIKNVRSGRVRVPSVREIIVDDANARGEIIVCERETV